MLSVFMLQIWNMKTHMINSDIWNRVLVFKMLGLYLDTLIIGHKCCSILIILNELTLQKELQNSMTNNVFGTKK